MAPWNCPVCGVRISTVQAMCDACQAKRFPNEQLVELLRRYEACVLKLVEAHGEDEGKPTGTDAEARVAWLEGLLKRNTTELHPRVKFIGEQVLEKDRSS